MTGHVRKRAAQRHGLRVDSRHTQEAEFDILAAKGGHESSALFIAAKIAGGGEIWSVMLAGKRVRVIWHGQIVTVLPAGALAEVQAAPPRSSAVPSLKTNPPAPTLADVMPAQLRRAGA